MKEERAAIGPGKSLLLQLAAALVVVFPTGLVLGQSPAAAPSETQPQDLINPDRPGIADGSSVIGAKRFQIETGFQEEFRRDGSTHEHTIFVPTLVRVGIDKRWEVRIEGNTFTRTTTTDVANGADHSSGFAPVSAGFKYHIGDFGAAQQTSVGAIVRVFPAWGSGDFRTHHVTGDARLAADWNFAPRLNLSLNPNVGLGRYEDDQGKTFIAGLFAVTLNYQPTKRLNPFVDLGLQTPEQKNGKSATILDLGVAYILGKNVQLDASVGSGAHGQTPPHPFIGFGISVRSRSSR